VKTVLVIDDDPTIRGYLGNLLERGGYGVVMLPDGEHAAGLCERGQFYAVITDLYMPNSDGIETVKAVRRAAPTLPIIGITGTPRHWSDPCARAMRALGASVLLSKPIDPRHLLDTLARFGAVSGGNDQ
jgi:CheY-like chemotaxis protein